MKISLSMTMSSIMSALRRHGLYMALFAIHQLFGANAFAADVVSVKVPEHSISVKVDSDGKVNITGEKNNAKHDDDVDEDSGQETKRDHDEHHHRHGNDIVQVFGDAKLGPGDHTHDLVAIMGTSTNEGDVDHDVVSVFGGTHVTGTVGHDAVAVMGSNYINSKVGHDVVAVMGNLELGPQAEVGNDVVVVGGSLSRDPAAIVHGAVNTVGPNINFGGFDWLKAWFQHCLLKGRLLAFDTDVMWAWWVAAIALLTYVLTALLFPRAVDRCVEVMEEHPGHVVLASLLAVIGMPVLMILLVITVIGIIAIPLIGIAFILTGLLGKVVILAWIGRRIVKKSDNGLLSHPVIAVLVGGVLVLLLYTVPVLSLILYKVIGFLGLGVALYALLLEIKSRRDRSGGSGGPTVSADLADMGPASASANSQTNLNAETSAPASGSTPAAAIELTRLPRAGFWVRMIALMIDAFLIGIITSMVIHPRWFGFDTDHVIVTMLAIYGAVMWKLRGATVGDVVFKLQVVRIDGRPIDWSTAIIRSLGCFLSIMVIGLGFFWIAFDENKQAWHDMIAGTLVVRTPTPMSLI